MARQPQRSRRGPRLRMSHRIGCRLLVLVTRTPAQFAPHCIRSRAKDLPAAVSPRILRRVREVTPRATSPAIWCGVMRPGAAIVKEPYQTVMHGLL
jgi:hypothetical protein